jgi:hypothetical protein
MEEDTGPEDEGLTGSGTAVRFPRERGSRRAVNVMTTRSAWSIAGVALALFASIALWGMRAFSHQQAEEVVTLRAAAIARAEAVILIEAHNHDPEAHSALVKLGVQQIAQQSATNAILARMEGAQESMRGEIAKLSVDMALIKGELSVMRGHPVAVK